MQAQNNDLKRILAIECAVGRGSLAVLEGTRPIASSEQLDVNPSRAEEVLVAIRNLIDSAGISLTDLDLIAVSNGPGSYSGIRIGIATGLGLKAALNIPLVGVSVLESMAGCTSAQRQMVTAIPVGKKDVAWQAFRMHEGATVSEHSPQLASEPDFVAAVSRDPETPIFAQSGLFTRLSSHDLSTPTVVDAGAALAGMIGSAAASGFGSDPNPIYLRNMSHAAGAPGF